MSTARLTFEAITFGVVDINGNPWLTMRDITAALYGGTEGGDRSVTPSAEASVRRVFSRHAVEFTADMTALVKLPTAKGMQKVRIFSLRGAHLLGMLARTPKAAAFRRWVLDVLEGVTHAPAALHARLIDAQRRESESFADASRHALALRQRQKVKPKLQSDIDKARAALQLALPWEGGQA